MNDHKNPATTYVHSVTYGVIRWSLVQALTTANVAATDGLIIPSTGLRMQSLLSLQDINPVIDTTKIIWMQKEATFS